MAGHSKWKNIAHRKEKTDAQRAKLFTKLSREIIVAVRAAGPDPASNPKLGAVIAKARAGNVPMENIQRVIARAVGGADNTNYESVQYEGYGPNGAAILVEAMTDNRTRTVAEMRHAFDKYGGNMGAPNSVAWMFDEKGIVIIDGTYPEEAAMLAALDSGASDFDAGDGIYEITCEPSDFGRVCAGLETAGYAFLSAGIERVPQTWVVLADEAHIKNMRKMLDVLEDNDDVQSVWHNWENEE
jgi:YebC/PmpR family DNA-binding regulatory protein